VASLLRRRCGDVELKIEHFSIYLSVFAY